MKPTVQLIPTRFLKIVTLGFSLGLCASFTSIALAGQTVQIAAENQQHLGIESIVTTRASTYPSRTYTGQAVVALDQSYLITAPLSGLVTKIIHFHGAAKKGDVIAQIQSPALLTAQKDFLNTLSDFNNAKYNLARAEKLMKTGVVSTKNFQSAKAEYNKAMQIKRQQQQDLALLGMAPQAIQTLVKTQQLQPAKLQITAPADGELFDLQVKAGERLNANQAIISLGSTDPIVIEVPVPVEDSKDLTIGQAVTVKTSRSSVTGEIELIPNVADPMTQTVLVHIDAPNANHALIPGQRVQAQFNIAIAPSEVAYKVPRNAVAQLAGQTVVFLKKMTEIQAIPIEILNIDGDSLYFKTTSDFGSAPEIVIKSTSAIKAVFEAEGGE
ncbi:hypothetical protein CYQ88_04625 [Hydrogenovibrio sp. SC-1]|uniref:efflux RND transporter periplasmic adaptor subunit n=1 Tax=Hydrogenovibrio sp. SC-1 TaxID=2065820 RepID=UPI000C7A7986|nr:efflux RND transporter periplasmic adaptor subunit [Hydrogenovibrio sp. SC-1]PLA74601.1 hypothetical protein CYQ88_04625 [Hydrogenovibrio sp. SC-1]